MSVITSYRLKAKDIKQRLIQNGYVHPDVLHDRRGKERHFENILDYNLCNPKRAAELRQRYAKNGWKKMTADGEWQRQEYTDKELDELMKYPIHFDQDGDTVLWFVNYGKNDTPSLFITDLYPNEVMSLTSNTECDLNYSIYIKGDKTCTKDGRIIDDMLIDINKSQIKDMGNNKSRVSLLLDITDKRPAYIYVDNNNIQDKNIDYPSDKKNICIEKLSGFTQVHRQLKDGFKTKAMMKFSDILELHDNAEKKRLENRPLPNTPQTESISSEDTYSF